MATLTVYAETSDGRVVSSDGTYSTARTGSALTTDGGTDIGQRKPGSYFIYQTFLDFITSALGASATVSSAVLKTTISGAGANVSGEVFEARLFDWGGTLSTADWIAGASLSAQTLLATYTSGGATSGDINWTNVAFPANVNKTGSTRILLCAKNQTDNVAPTAEQYLSILPAETAGTASDPTLTITYTTSVTHEAAGTLSGGGTLAGTATLVTAWKYELDGLYASIDVSKTGTNNGTGLAALDSADYLIEVMSDPRAYETVSTLKETRTVKVYGASAAAPSATWDTPGVQVTAPANLSDVATITLKATSAPAGWTVKLFIATGTGSPTPTVDHTADVSPALSAPPASSTAYTYAAGLVRDTETSGSLKTMVVRADLYDGTATLKDSRTVRAYWYSP